jgi:hypothetical protein
MKIHKSLVLDQNSEEMEKLAERNGTTRGICGFVTCAIVEYLAKIEDFSPLTIKSVNAVTMTPRIETVMKTVLSRRRLELKKYYKVMSDNDRKIYLKDWVANYEIA